ncbi:copper homeostasis membrane protein CopD [Erwinia sp. HDF1-3R]|uniref:copper homeostasis membrane protein CopD n=1 Tax=Erwinia sp. HDF1-3R TaxID=3141543 RepID=UPI0031F4AFBF
MSVSLCWVLCRWLHFMALLTLTGASAFTVFLAPAQFRAHMSVRLSPLLKSGAIASLLTAVLLLVIQTGMMGNGWQDVSNVDVWRLVLQTRFGVAWQWQLIAGVVGVAALGLKGRGQQCLLLLSGIGQLAGLAFTGHAAMLDGALGFLQRSNHAVHLISAAFWAGGLLPVLLLMADVRQPARNDAIHTLMRFSRYGHLAVALVLLSGVVNAWLLLGWPPGHFQLYSRLLLLKIALVGLMCGIALFNRYWLVPRFQHSGEQGQRRFIQATLAELLLAAMVLLLVSLFATLEPA